MIKRETGSYAWCVSVKVWNLRKVSILSSNRAKWDGSAITGGHTIGFDVSEFTGISTITSK